MKKIATSIALASVLLSVNVYANTDKRSEKEIRDEIQRLKMENELLELKNENERLQKGGSSSKAKNKNNADVYNANVDKSGFLGFCKNQFAGTGCYVGVEIGVADVDIYRKFSSETPFALESDLQKVTSIPLYLTFGYKHHFTEKQAWGVRAYLGYSSHSAKSNKKVTEYSERVNNGVDSEWVKLTGRFTEFNSSAIHFGIEAEYFYHFLIGKHTLAGSAGFGINFTNFMNQDVTSAVESSNPMLLTIAPSTEELDSYLNFTTLFSIGLHYTYKNTHTISLRSRAIHTGLKEENKSIYNGAATISYYTNYGTEYLVGYSYKF